MLLAGMAGHSLFSVSAVPATVAMRRLRHLDRSDRSQVAPDTIAAAANLIKIPPALCPASAGAVVIVVAQTRDVTPPGTAVVPMLAQNRRIITVPTPPGESHRVNHRDDVDLLDHLSGYHEDTSLSAIF
jgi:hypothetical protein